MLVIDYFVTSYIVFLARKACDCDTWSKGNETKNERKRLYCVIEYPKIVDLCQVQF